MPDGLLGFGRKASFNRGRATEKGLRDAVEFRLQDYRDIDETFDRIVSVGMFEHVGVGYYDTFFRKCAELLDRDGVMVLHSIGRPEGPNVTNPWIAKYIFPGGYIPAISEVIPAIERAGLLIAETTISQTRFNAQGQSEASRIRQTIQYAATIDEAVAILQRVLFEARLRFEQRLELRHRVVVELRPKRDLRDARLRIVAWLFLEQALVGDWVLLDVGVLRERTSERKNAGWKERILKT